MLLISLRIVHAGDIGPSATFEAKQNGHTRHIEAVYKGPPQCSVWKFELAGADLDKGCVTLRARVWDDETSSEWSNEIIRCPEPRAGLGIGVLALGLLTRWRHPRT